MVGGKRSLPREKKPSPRPLARKKKEGSDRWREKKWGEVRVRLRNGEEEKNERNSFS